MTRWIGRIAAVLFLGGVAGHGALAAAPGPTGQWVVEDGKAAVDLEPCGDKLCGKIAWLKIPLNDQGKPKTDIHDGDSALQTRPLCGLLMLWDFTLNEDGFWSGGKIYDAEHGDVYSSTMHIQDDGRLRVRGYIGISLFGKSQIWTRPVATLPHC